MAVHIRSRLWDSALLFHDVHTARMVARTVLKIGRNYELVLFAIVGDHAHFVVLTTRRRAGVFARAVEAALTMVCGHAPGFRPAHFQPVFTEDHLEHLVPYVLGQHRKHGLRGDPLLEATNLLDLLSIRLVDTACAKRLKTALPQLHREDLVAELGFPIEAGTDVHRLAEAVQVLTGGEPFNARSPAAARARGAAVRASRDLGLGVGATSALLGLHRSTVRRNAASVDDVADRALLHALGLVQRAAPTGFPAAITLAERRWTPGSANRTHIVARTA